MRNSKILAKLRAGEHVRIAHLGHYLPFFIAAAAQTGYDGIWLDLEHHAMDQRETQSLLAFCHLYDIDCMVRPATREKAPLYRYLEDGATGFLIPHLNSAAEAQDMVQKCKFPPVGDRGMEGFGLETSFSYDVKESPLELVQHANRETFLFVQIETPGGLADADAIAAMPGIDGLFIGPFDLMVRMAHQPTEAQVSFDDTLNRVAAAARAHTKPWGSFALSAEAIREQVARGAQILALGMDLMLIKEGLARCESIIDEILRQ
ncbi:MAG: 4-hydroxy-2-oxovalerate aldolase [Anaerolineae bacterium]|nr:4-hydroxy-2-oxovalerate aldolase [Anaerolineae bacterium]